MFSAQLISSSITPLHRDVVVRYVHAVPSTYVINRQLCFQLTLPRNVAGRASSLHGPIPLVSKASLLRQVEVG